MKAYDGMEAKFKLRPATEPPDHSCEVLVFFHDSAGEVYCIQNTQYSAKWKEFNADDLCHGCKSAYAVKNFFWAYID